MKNKTIKIISLSILPLIMIATIYYYYSLRIIFYRGRTQYFPEANEESMLRTPEGDRWVTSGWAHSIAFDHKGNMWIADGGLYKFDGKNRTSFTKGLLRNDPYLVTIDPTDRVWFTYGFSAVEPGLGVTVFDGNTWTTFNISNSGLTSNEVEAIAFDPENRAWIGTTHGLSVFDGNKWTTFSQSNSGLAADHISSIAFDKRGRAWIATYGPPIGINVFDGKEWVFSSLQEIGFWSAYSTLGPDIFIDPSERIWIQNDGDVRIFDGGNWIGLAEEDGYNNNVFSIAVDQRAKIWTTNGNNRGLIEFDSGYRFDSAWRTQPPRIFLASGGIWYIAFILVCLFIAMLRGYIVPITLALFSGIAITIVGMAIFKDPHLFYFFPIPIGNPGVYATVGATIGTFSDIIIASRSGAPKRAKFAIIGFIIGLAIGICAIAPFMLMQ